MEETARQGSGPGRQPGPLFVVGVPRSGTTLLSSLLNAHREIAIAPETHYFTQHWGICVEALRPEGNGPHWLIDRLLETPEFRDLHLDGPELQAVHDLVPAGHQVTHADVYSAFLRVYAAKHHKVLTGEKTPAYLLRARTLVAQFPAARFVCIVRDPRDVTLSWRAAGWRGTAAYHALVWRSFQRAAAQHRAHLGDAFLVVRYEDLLADPDAVLRACCGHVGLDFDPGMLHFHQGERRNFDPLREPWKNKATQPLDPSNSGRWLTDLSPGEVATIEWLARREMVASGYEPSAVPVTRLLRPALLLGSVRDLVLFHRVRHDRRGPLAWLSSSDST